MQDDTAANGYELATFRWLAFHKTRLTTNRFNNQPILKLDNRYRPPISEIAAEERTNWKGGLFSGLLVAVALNFVPTALSWNAHLTDGVEQVGFPFVFFERGGFNYREVFYPRLFWLDAGLNLTVVSAIVFIRFCPRPLRIGRFRIEL